MIAVLTASCEAFAAEFAAVWVIAVVLVHVEFEMTARGIRSVADGAFECFGLPSYKNNLP